ncbi:hypothetical protein C1645_826727 [Glomus cerebriforme]|uniref:Uncharacterized protein n=1 Tax=Glomus cerebriforme TaxID=658196 RepID=A0A397STF2_9GLOM|nr:hypothetical protein C1645_826727 [Glomus cerebriforme]
MSDPPRALTFSTKEMILSYTYTSSVQVIPALAIGAAAERARTISVGFNFIHEHGLVHTEEIY